MTLKLHGFGESGNSYKAALPLTLSGIDWAPVWGDVFNGAARSRECWDLRPMGDARVLGSEDVTFSPWGAIQHWIIEETGLFGGRGAAEAREVPRWQFRDNHKARRNSACCGS